MAKITPEDVDHIAGLAQLTLDDETRQRLVVQLNDILSYIDKLNELDTEGIEPMMHAVPMTNVYRDDVVGQSLDREKALMNAPKTDGEYFLVPRILDQE
jgi:aspartyl-tRNA(Asn)/glutamyl-tRNA(Gln) amidotransferase subunit C